MSPKLKEYQSAGSFLTLPVCFSLSVFIEHPPFPIPSNPLPASYALSIFLTHTHALNIYIYLCACVCLCITSTTSTLLPNPFCSPAQRRWEVVLFCPQINRPYSPLSQAAEATSSLYFGCTVHAGGGRESERKRGGTQGCSPACLMHYWGVHLSHQLQVEGWNTLISCCRQKRGGKHSWPQLKSSICEVDADVTLWVDALGFVLWDSEELDLHWNIAVGFFLSCHKYF